MSKPARCSVWCQFISLTADRPMVAAKPPPTFSSQGSPAVIVEPQSLSSGLQDFWQFTSLRWCCCVGKRCSFGVQDEKIRLPTLRRSILFSFGHRRGYCLNICLQTDTVKLRKTSSRQSVIQQITLWLWSAHLVFWRSSVDFSACEVWWFMQCCKCLDCMD